MGVIEYFKEALISGFRGLLKDLEKDIDRLIIHKIEAFKRRIFHDIMGMFFIFLAIGTLAIAGVFFFIEYLGLNKTLSFLIVGIIFLIISILFKIMR